MQPEIIDSKMGRQLLQGQSLPLVLDEHVSRRVRGLLLFSCPSAIFRGIRPIDIHSIKRHAFRARPHINQKRQEARSPLRTNRNAPAAVPVEFNVLCVVAPLFHPGPRSVFSWIKFGERITGCTSSRTSATVSTSAFKIACGDIANNTAVAPADPSNFFDVACSMEHNPSPKTLPSSINEIRSRTFCDGHVAYLCGDDLTSIARWQIVLNSMAKDRLERAQCKGAGDGD